jgi:nucleoid DNA-binding protein
MAREKGMSCRRLYTEIAKCAPVKMTAVEAREFLRSVSAVIAKNVAPQHVVRIPQLATFRMRFNNPRPERTKRIGSGNEFVVAAKPVTAVLKATASHELQKAVRYKQGDDKKQNKKMRANAPTVAHDEASETQQETSDDLN